MTSPRHRLSRQRVASSIGKGRIDFKQVRRALDDIEFSGWLQLETSGSLGQFTANCRYLKSIFPSRV